MIYRLLGKTGERVSAIGVGGWHLGQRPVDEALAIRIVRTAIDAGINFLDNCWDYHEGASEIRMGKALRDGYRAQAFLMTKIDGRSKESATRQLDESLKRFGVDHIDLVKRGRVRRAKLYYLRGLRGKAARIRERDTRGQGVDASASAAGKK